MLNRVRQLTIIGIIVGMVAMFQPFVFALFGYGFVLLLISTVGFIGLGYMK